MRKTLDTATLVRDVHRHCWEGTPSAFVNLSYARGITEAIPRLTPGLYQDILEYVRVLRFDKKQTATSINRRLSVLSRLLKYAQDTDQFLYTGAIPWLKHRRGKDRVILPHEFEAFTEMARARRLWLPEAYLTVGCKTGLRPVEFLGLRGPDFTHDTIKVPEALSKNGQPRIIPFTDPEIHFILRRTSQQQYSYRTLYQHWTRVMSVLDLDRPFTPYATRHTFATRLIEAGVSVVVVKELLGHSDLAMTLRYVHVSPEHHKEAVKLI